MSAVDEIQAAIDKLTAMRADSRDGPWLNSGTWWLEGVEHHVVYGPNLGEVAFASDDADAELIAVLHRTIDAQLTILRGALTRPASTFDMREYDLEALALARAINA